MNLEETLNKNWKKVMEKFYYPGLPMPKLSDSNQLKTASIDMINHQIMINKDFVDYFKQKGLSLDTIFTGLLAHEVNHYITCPFNLARGLMIDLWTKEIDTNVAKIASGLYVDIVDNLDLIMKKDVTEVAELLREQDANDQLSKVIKAYYQKSTGFNMNIDTDNELDDFMKIQLERLVTIDFSDIKREKNNVKRFTRVVRDIVNNYNLSDKNKEMQQRMLGNFDPKAYDKNEINKALKEIATLLTKEEFDKCVKENSLLGLLGLSNETVDVDDKLRDTLYYIKLAEIYSIKVKKRKIEQDSSMFPYSHKSFEVEDNPQDIDVFCSLGKPFIPGLGKTWVKKQGSHFGQKQGTPDVLIMKDISISMNSCNPYAEIACIAASDSYLRNGSKVAVYLFNDKVDDVELAKGYQFDKTSISSALIKTNNGGTVINNESLEKLDDIIKKSQKELDIVLVTDLEISGRESLFKYLHDREDTHRVTIIYTGNSNIIKELQEKYNNSKFAIYSINRPEDIPKIIIGEVTRD